MENIEKSKNEGGEIVVYNSEFHLSIFQKGKRFVFIPDIDKLKKYLESMSGMDFTFETANNCNYFYNFSLEPKKLS